MTVADNYDIEKQETNGTTKIFSFNFYTASKDFVKVILEVDGEQSVVPTTDYTIKLNTVGGTVTFTRAPASGGYIIITRETPREQETSFATSSGFPAKTVEGRFDKLTAMIQEMQDTDNRTPSFPVGTDLNVTLPLPEAGKALVWNDTEDNLENSETTFDEIVSDAISAKNDAVAAKEAAETAQGKAEDARDDAQAAQGYAEAAQTAAEYAKTQAENTVAGFDDHADSKIGEVNTLVGQAEGYATVAENKANAAAGSANDASGYATAASGYASSASTSATNASVWAEGTDEEVEALGGEHSAKEWNSILSSSIGDATLTIQRNSEQLATFTANSTTDTTVNIYVPTTPEEINAMPATTTINDLTTEQQQNALNSGITSTGVAQITTNKNNITSISAVIPVQATDQNQLADKSFVNSSIATNTANFIGTFNSVAELEGYSGPVTNNDYAFVVGTDSAGNTTYDRYKYTDATTPASWVFEYTLNNSSFTSNQWAAINSGATTTNIGQIATNKTAIGTLSSLATTEKTNLVGAINEVKTTADSKVSDTTVDGTSIVNNGVAVLPLAQQSGGYGLTKFGDTSLGLSVGNTGIVKLVSATTTNIDNKTVDTRIISPANLDYAVKRGVAYNSLTLTDAEKASACSLVGALPNNIYGESTTAAATVQKEVSIPSITSLNAGQLIIVKPTVTSTVANSTLKLNNFDAYPMLYGGVAITTSTDSYVWIKDVPGWWLFDGSNWLFAGHGTDINTTYNSTTIALMIEGTNTTNRLIAPATLKDGTFGVVTAYASGDTITPSDKYLYNSTSNISALTIAAPSSPDVRYMAQINMSSGSTATTFSYPPAFKIIEGCDDVQYVQGTRTFVPVANKRYQVFIENDGVNTILWAKGI